MPRIRKAIFWAHLGVGIAVGLIVLTMSATGVILTYERQILRAIDDGTPTSGDPLLAADRLIEATLAAADAPVDSTISLRHSSAEGSPVLAKLGRSEQFLLDPGTAEVLRRGPSSVEIFFDQVTSIHRWFALEGDRRNIGLAITGYANLGFFFLLISGIYLWLPKLWTAAILRSQVLLKRRYATGKARDWAWHRVFSFWAVIPLIFIISTATVFYFPWANAMVYGYFGESVPERRGSSGESGSGAAPSVPSRSAANAVQRQLHTWLDLAGDMGIDWRTLTIEAKLIRDSEVVLQFDDTLGGRPQAVRTLTLAPSKSPSWQTLADRSPGRQARSIIRFLHTGEVLGLPGQTVAGLASLASCLLVWSGLALAWRRLVRPMLVRQSV